MWFLDDGNGSWNPDGDVLLYMGIPDDGDIIGDWDGL